MGTDSLELQVCQDKDTDAKLRFYALVFSCGIIFMMVIAHIIFEWYGKHLPMPDIVWFAALSPWVGASAGKLFNLVKRR